MVVIGGGQILCCRWQDVDVTLLHLIGEMVEGKLLPQLELSLLSAAGFGRRLGEDHRVGCGQRHPPL